MKRLLATMLALLLLFTCGVSATSLTWAESAGGTSEIGADIEEKSQARLDYESLLEGDYRGSAIAMIQNVHNHHRRNRSTRPHMLF